MILQVYTDGGSKGNPGPSTIAGVFYLGSKKTFQFNQSIGKATNNEAEYLALIKALEKVMSYELGVMRVTQIQFYSDSRLMINQVKGLFKVKKGKIREYILRIRILEQEIKIPISYYLIPREENWEADRLVNSL